MGSIKQKFITIDEQINFINGAVKVLQGTENFVVMKAEHVQMLNDIGSNLQTIRNWINLPDFHQAAMQVLDDAYNMNADLLRQGIKRPLSMAIELTHEIERLNKEGNKNTLPLLLQRVAALSLIAVERCIVDSRRKKEVSNG